MPGDRPERFAKAGASGADAIILDLEDSVAPERKAFAREAVAKWLRSQPADVPSLVRINPLDSEACALDLAMIAQTDPDALVLPKAEGADSIRRLDALLDGSTLSVLPIATETPVAVFAIGSLQEVPDRLLGVTWGAEDLPAAIGATSSREDDGRYTAPYELVRSLTLFAAKAAGAAAIETVYPNLSDMDGLAAYVARARRDGFTGMMALHPKQIPVINAGFSATEAELDQARSIVSAFEADGHHGAISFGGKMVDLPHLKQARQILARDAKLLSR